VSTTGHNRLRGSIEPDPLDAALEDWAGRHWPGGWFVRGAARSGRLAVLYAAALGARSGHDYLGCEHLVAGSLRAGGLPQVATAGELRRVAVAAVAASQMRAEVLAEHVEEWFADADAAIAAVALGSVRVLPTLTPRAARALLRARGQAAAASAMGGAGAVHVLSGVLADPGIVAPAATREGVSLEPARLLAERRAGWGPLLDLLDEG